MPLHTNTDRNFSEEQPADNPLPSDRRKWVTPQRTDLSTRQTSGTNLASPPNEGGASPFLYAPTS